MDLILGLAMGAFIGGLAFAFLRSYTGLGLATSVLLGSVGGGAGAQLAMMVSTAPGIDGAANLFSLVVAAATATACLLIARTLERR